MDRSPARLRERTYPVNDVRIRSVAVRATLCRAPVQFDPTPSDRDRPACYDFAPPPRALALVLSGPFLVADVFAPSESGFHRCNAPVHDDSSLARIDLACRTL